MSSVQFGVVSVTNNTTINISSVDPSKSMVILNMRGNGSDYSVGCYHDFVDNTTIEIITGSGFTSSVTWQVVEG